jgi:hypothetical protein
VVACRQHQDEGQIFTTTSKPYVPSNESVLDTETKKQAHRQGICEGLRKHSSLLSCHSDLEHEASGCHLDPSQ